MTTTCIHNAKIVSPGEGTQQGALLFNECITQVLTGESEPRADVVKIDAGGKMLTPGLIDLHTHGIGTYLYERSPEDLIEGTELLAKFGTTSVLPTIYKALGTQSL